MLRERSGEACQTNDAGAPLSPRSALRWAPASPVAAWTWVFAGGFGLACVAAPAVYALLLAASPQVEWPFSRVFNRVAMACGVVVLLLVRRAVGWEELRRLINRGSRGENARETGAGFLAALAGVAVGLTAAFRFGELGWPAHEYRFFALRTATALAGAVVAGFLEEAFFRGMMLPRLAAGVGWRRAVLATSFAYAVVHLMVSDPTFRRTGYSPLDGFSYLQQVIARQLEPASLAVLFGLFVLGLSVAEVVRRTGSLYLAIGLHAGWAFCFQSARHGTRVMVEIPGSSLLATRQFLLGRPWAWAALVFSSLLAVWWVSRSAIAGRRRLFASVAHVTLPIRARLRPMSRVLRRLFLVVMSLILVAGAVAAGAFVWMSRSGRPQRRGEAAIAGLGAAVEVRFDGWGVPHVRAASGRDLAAALGWLHANDRFFQMELGRRAAAGRLSELLGDRTVELDRSFRELRLRRAAERLWEGASDESRDWLVAYASGVNAWLTARGTDLPPELELLGARPEPWEPVDSLGFVLLMARDLSFWDGRPEEVRFGWLRAFGPERARQLVGPPAAEIPAAIAALAAGSSPAVASSVAPAGSTSSPDLAAGSNNWAVGAERSATGSALVANDPHLALRLPGVWFEAHLVAPDYEVSGVTIPGTPGVVIGRTARLAWAFTNVMLDDHDLFFEQLDATGAQVRRGAGWSPVKRETSVIRVRGGAEVRLELAETDRGPLLPADPARRLPARSLAWTAYEPADPLKALTALARASRVEEVPAAIGSFVCPAQNLVVGDVQGGLLHAVLGRLPHRLAGDGRFPSPGWDPAYGWNGLLPASENPVRRAPADGMLVTANNDSWGSTRPAALVADFDSPHRADRIASRLGERRDWTAEALVAVQTDVTSRYALEVVSAIAGDYRGEAGRAYRELRAWNGAMGRHGAGALFVLLERELRTRLFADEATAAGIPRFDSRERLLGLLHGEIDASFVDDVSTPQHETRAEIVTAALAAAWREGSGRFGPAVSQWPYGEIHQLTLSHPLGALPILGPWFDRGPMSLPGSATTVDAFGAVWKGDRQAVTYGPSMRRTTDLRNPDTTFSVLPGGQSGHPGDRHYDDQLRLYLAGESRPVAWSEAAVSRATVSVLRLLPASR